MAGGVVVAFWKLLILILAAVLELVSQDSSLRPPTELKGLVNPKHAYAGVFDCSHFTITDAKLPRKEDKQNVMENSEVKTRCGKFKRIGNEKSSRLPPFKCLETVHSTENFSDWDFCKVLREELVNCQIVVVLFYPIDNIF